MPPHHTIMVGGAGGYESPMEDVPTRPGSGNATPAGWPSSGPTCRLDASRPPAINPTFSSSLSGMLSKAERLPGSKVSVKDRIACYQWTWFTMVCHFQWLFLRYPLTQTCPRQWCVHLLLPLDLSSSDSTAK